MEKKLKKVQRAAAVGFVLLKILRILLIIAAVLMIICLVVLAVVNENNLPLDAARDGKLVLELEKFPDVGSLVRDGVLTLDLKDAKLVAMLLVGAGIIALAAAYVLLLLAGNLFKHMKTEDTPFTAGNVRRLRALGFLHIGFWICGIALGYLVSSELIRRLSLTSDVILSLNLSALLASLIYFLLARVFSFGQAQGEAIRAALPAVEPQPAPEYEPEPAPAPQPVYPAPEYEPEPAVEPETPAEAAAPDMEAPAEPEA